MNEARRALLDRFSRAFNSDDRAATRDCVTGDFAWIDYEGPESPHGRRFEGVDAACQAVVDRAARLAEPIVFAEGEHFECGEKVFVTYRASGRFHDTGRFDVRAVDIYTFRGDRLAEKDTYWKIVGR